MHTAQLLCPCSWTARAGSLWKSEGQRGWFRKFTGEDYVLYGLPAPISHCVRPAHGQPGVGIDHADDHAVVQARDDVPMRGVHRNQYGLSRFYGLLLSANDHNPVTLQAKHDFIRNRMAVQTILLSWLEGVHVAMERLRLSDPFPNEACSLRMSSDSLTLSFHADEFPSPYRQVTSSQQR